jgi:DNA-binding response OmpR family regulator
MTHCYDLVILDVILPKLDGLGLCRRVRSHHMHLPILMLTARDTLTDKIIGLDAGADDYMVKPFELPELQARLRALWRRSQMLMMPDLLVWGELQLNPSTHEVTYGSELLHLTPKEFALLQLLIAHGRRVLSRAAIVEEVWPLAAAPMEETVKSHVKGLRQKLRSAGAPDDLIETVHGVGYRLKALEH